METTTIKIPTNLLPLWKSIERLNDQERKDILVILNNYNAKKKEKESSPVVNERSSSSPNKHRIFITPEIRALEKGYKIPADISDDYKKEIGDLRAERFL